jgi:galactose mutarotase-like enzyme
MIRPPTMLQAAGMLLIFCASFLGKSVERRIRVCSFGNAKYGEPINRYLLANERSMKVAIINDGAGVVSLSVPDRDGKVADAVLGYDDLGGYEADKSYFGASIGRDDNRIAARQFTLDHQLLLRAARFTTVDAALIPTREERAVARSPFDFRKAVAIGARINENDQQLKFGEGYDDNSVLEDAANGGLQVAAEVYEPSSGRLLEVQTTEPGIQFYSGNLLDGTVKGTGGQSYGHRTGFCLETQHFPGSPNHANFPSTELKPGQSYKSTTVLRFSSRN